MDDDVSGVEISVKDTGIGLDAEHHELVFEKFYQVGSVAIHSSGKTTFKGGGPGLGLALVCGVARAHGGKVWVESAGCDEVNFPGSTFYLQLPVNSHGKVG
jgi:signal transduction histidine kinase